MATSHLIDTTETATGVMMTVQMNPDILNVLFHQFNDALSLTEKKHKAAQTFFYALVRSEIGAEGVLKTLEKIQFCDQAIQNLALSLQRDLPQSSDIKILDKRAYLPILSTVGQIFLMSSNLYHITFNSDDKSDLQLCPLYNFIDENLNPERP